jgi:phosphatidylinositol kinase/protein kinase (PI-3  family)
MCNREICVKTFLELRRHHKKITLLLEMLSHGNEHLPFFSGNPQKTIIDFRKRFRLDLGDSAAAEFVHTLIEGAAGDWTTSCYDRYQRCCVGIF